MGVQADHPPRRSVILDSLVMAVCLVPLAAAAAGGVSTINGLRSSTDGSPAVDYHLWQCVEGRLKAMLPAGRRVFVSPASTSEAVQRLGELSQPDFVLLSAAQPGSYRLELIRFVGSAQHGDCPPYRLTATVVR